MPSPPSRHNHPTPSPPNLHLCVLGQYPLPVSHHSPAKILPLDLEWSSNRDLPSGYWGTIPPKKRLSQESHALSPTSSKTWTWILRGSPPTPTVYWTLLWLFAAGHRVRSCVLGGPRQIRQLPRVRVNQLRSTSICRRRFWCRSPEEAGPS